MPRLAGKLFRYDISVREAGRPRGGSVVPVRGDGALLNASCRHILLFVHGFNDTVDDVETAYAAALKNYTPDLLTGGSRPDAVVCLQWPGDVAVGPFKVMDAAGYPWDLQQAQASAQQLADFLVSLCQHRNGNFKISVVAHSMGCRLIVETLKILPPFVAGAFNVVGLMAAAVPVDLVEASGTRYGAAAALCGTDRFPRKTMKFFSSDDLTLALAFPAGQAAAFAVGIEPGIFLDAVGRAGYPAGFGTTVHRSTGDTHSEYWADPAVETAIMAAIDPTHPVPRPVRQQQIRKLPAPNAIPSRNPPRPRSLA